MLLPTKQGRMLFLIFVSTLLVAVAAAQKQALNYMWWHHSSEGEKTGFVLGYFDCPNAPKFVYGATSDDYISFVDKTILNSDMSSEAVPKVLQGAHRNIHVKPIPKGGEEYPEKHGWLDGEWWGDTTHGDPDEHLGYVEGYSACGSGFVYDSAETRLLVAKLNHHFGDARNEHHKIANVLQSMIDRKTH